MHRCKDAKEYFLFITALVFVGLAVTYISYDNIVLRSGQY